MFVQGVNREAGATRGIALVKPDTAPATVNERGMDSVNPPRRMDQTATAPQAWEGGSSGAMPLMSPETDPAVNITVIDTVSRGVTCRCKCALEPAAGPTTCHTAAYVHLQLILIHAPMTRGGCVAMSHLEKPCAIFYRGH